MVGKKMTYYNLLKLSNILVISDFILLSVEVNIIGGVDDHILEYLINRTYHFPVAYLSHSFLLKFIVHINSMEIIVYIYNICNIF